MRKKRVAAWSTIKLTIFNDLVRQNIKLLFQRVDTCGLPRLFKTLHPLDIVAIRNKQNPFESLTLLTTSLYPAFFLHLALSIESPSPALLGSDQLLWSAWRKTSRFGAESVQLSSRRIFCVAKLLLKCMRFVTVFLTFFVFHHLAKVNQRENSFQLESKRFAWHLWRRARYLWTSRGTEKLSQ